MFDKTVVSLEKVLKFFYSFHDPTELDRQGNDAGSQYASAIFYYTQDQKDIATAVTAKVQEKIDSGFIKQYKRGSVVTKVWAATAYYAAEKEHQRYLEAQPGGYCNHRIMFDWKEL